MINLCLLTGKRPKSDKEAEHLFQLFYNKIKVYDVADIQQAFNDDRLIDDIVKEFGGLNISTIRKYIEIHSTKRQRKQTQENREKLGKDIGQVIPIDSKEALAKLGILVGGLSEKKSL
jgi:hypothetical protein